MCACASGAATFLLLFGDLLLDPLFYLPQGLCCNFVQSWVPKGPRTGRYTFEAGCFFGTLVDTLGYETSTRCPRGAYMSQNGMKSTKNVHFLLNGAKHSTVPWVEFCRYCTKQRRSQEKTASIPLSPLPHPAWKSADTVPGNPTNRSTNGGCRLPRNISEIYSPLDAVGTPPLLVQVVPGSGAAVVQACLLE